MARARRRYRFVRAWAGIQVVAGCLVVIVGGLAAVSMFLSWPSELLVWVPGEWRGLIGRPAGVVVLLVATVVGGSLALTGELLLMLRDIHGHLARLDARSRRRLVEPVTPSERPEVTARLLPRQ